MSANTKAVEALPELPETCMHLVNDFGVNRGAGYTEDQMRGYAFEAVALAAAQTEPKVLDDPKLQELFSVTIDGALTFGYQGVNPPPAGHWLNLWWDKGRAAAQAEKSNQEALTVADYEGSFADHRRLVRQLDVLLNGEDGAASQASLCDVVGYVKSMKDAGTPFHIGEHLSPQPPSPDVELRDTFAAASLARIIDGVRPAAEIAVMAYQLADQMLLQRSKS